MDSGTYDCLDLAALGRQALPCHAHPYFIIYNTAQSLKRLALTYRNFPPSYQTTIRLIEAIYDLWTTPAPSWFFDTKWPGGGNFWPLSDRRHGYHPNDPSDSESDELPTGTVHFASQLASDPPRPKRRADAGEELERPVKKRRLSRELKSLDPVTRLVAAEFSPVQLRCLRVGEPFQLMVDGINCLVWPEGAATRHARAESHPIAGPSRIDEDIEEQYEEKDEDIEERYEGKGKGKQLK